MISTVLVVTLLLAGVKKPIEHRIPVANPEECARRGAAIAQHQMAELPSGGKVTIACEFSRT